ncbi:MAG: zinc ribbon domain-containing protein [bacterium]|nr:zinc ribbon domain-containing protein [bacterium]
MPTYDYRCNACGHTFELFQSMSEKHKRKCPECSKLKLERLIGMGAGVIFKGGGFYETDYRSDSYKSDHAADKKVGKEAESTDSSDGDTNKKPEKKAAGKKPGKKKKD